MRPASDIPLYRRLVASLAPAARRPLAARWAVLLLFTAAAAGWLLARPASLPTLLVVNGLACVLGHLLAAAFAALPLSRRPRPDSHPALPRACTVSFSLGLLLMAAGQALYYFFLLVVHQHPFPSAADIGFTLSYPALIGGILLLPGRRAHRARVLMDSLIVVTALGTFTWYYFVGPALLHGGPTPLAGVLAPAYPVLDLLALFSLLLVSGSTRTLRSHAGTRLVFAGLTLILFADTLFGYLNLAGAWLEGTPLDLAWPVGYSLIGLGVAHLRTLAPAPASADADADAGRDTTDALPSLLRSALPYLLIPCVGALIIHIEFSGNDHTYAGRGAYALAVLLVSVVILRQLHAIHENASLNRHLRLSEARFRAIFERAGVGIALVDPAGRPAAANPELARMLGYTPDELARLPFATFTHPADVAADLDSYRQLLDGRIDHYQIEKRYLRKDGQVVWGRLTASLIRDDLPGAQRFALGMVEDITARKLAEDRTAFQATHDALTGLPNRALFLERVERALARARADPDFRFAVLFLDLDRFKNVNDSLGHAAGDQLLRSVARRLQATVDAAAPPRPAVHTVARLGGDEFTLLLEGLAHPEQLPAVARALLASISLPYDLDGHEVLTSPSIGLVAGAPDYACAADLLRDADAAMYAAKAAGRNRYACFDPAMHDAALRRLRLESDLRRAVERDQLVLHFQPILSLESRQTLGFEALVRWDRDGDGQLVFPAEFIAIAEDTGLIVPIGAWVLRAACRQLAAWRADHPGSARDLSVSVNLSRRQLADPNLLRHLLGVLRETGLPPAAVTLEITESIVMHDGPAALETLRQLKRVGVRLALDDFGTGYSSLSLLHELPIDVLKVDRSFVAHLSRHRDTAAVIGAVIALAHNLNMTVVAEGLETPEHVAFLQALDCDFGQGYLFAKPLPAPAASAFLAPAAAPLRQSA